MTGITYFVALPFDVAGGNSAMAPGEDVRFRMSDVPHASSSGAILAFGCTLSLSFFPAQRYT